jgi:hypothetical protein
MKERGISIPIGRNAYLEDGTRVSAQLVQPEWAGVSLTSTEEHEVIHAVVSEKVLVGSVDEVSIVPGPGYLGYMRPNRMTAAAAIAPHALGMSGTGHDVMIVEHMGGSSGAGSVARTIVRESSDEIKAVGLELKKKKTLTGGDVREAMKSPDGAEQKITRKSTRENLFVTESELPLAA